MSKIRSLMKDLNLQDNLIETTLNKIENVCRNYEENPSRHFAYRMIGNGNGNGDGDN